MPIRDAYSPGSNKAALDETSTELLHELSVDIKGVQLICRSRGVLYFVPEL